MKRRPVAIAAASLAARPDPQPIESAALARVPTDDVAVVHPVTAYLESLAEGSRRTMREALDLAAALAAGLAPDDVEARHGLAMKARWWTMRGVQTGALRSRLAQHYAPSTCNKVLAAVSGTLRQCRRAGLMNADDLADALDFKRVPGSRLPAGRALSPDEVRALTAAAGADAMAARDFALVALLAGSGLRRAEIAGLTLADFDPITGKLRVVGKGNKERIVPLGPTPRAWMQAWLAVRGAASGPLFTRMGRGGRPSKDGALSTEAVYAGVARVALRSGVKPVPTPHDFRRTFITELLDRGVDVFTVAKLAGHANVETTRRYDRRPERAMADATSALDGLFTGDKPTGREPLLSDGPTSPGVLREPDGEPAPRTTTTRGRRR